MATFNTYIDGYKEGINFVPVVNSIPIHEEHLLDLNG